LGQGSYEESFRKWKQEKIQTDIDIDTNIDADDY